MDSANKVCKPLKSNNTESIPGWEGIPEGSVLNALIATWSLIILSVIRIIYFKYKPYQNDWNISWLQFIYSDRNVALLHSRSHINRLHPNAYLPPCLQEYSNLITNKLQENSPGSSLYVINTMAENMKKKHQAKIDSIGRNRYWLLDYILIKDKDIYEHRGNDAFQYLLFQRYIIYFLTALTAVCMILLMPINIFGKSGGDRYFEMTTINNIKDSSNIFWIHAIIAIAVVILGLLMMKNFSDLIFTPTTESDDRTILIQNVPEAKRNARLLKNFIEKKFLGVEVTQIWLTYDVEMLKQLKKQQETIESALIYTAKFREEFGYPLQVSPQIGGRFTPLCPSVDAAAYYTEQKAEYKTLVNEEVNRLLTDPKHAVFLQLKNELMAQRILEHFNNTQHERVFKRLYRYLKSCFVSEVRPDDADSFCYHSWVIKAAPFPDDIEWKDIIMNTNRSGVCVVLLNCLVILIFIFLTTPLVAVNFLDSFFSNAFGKNGTMSNIIDTSGSTKIQLAKYLGVLIFNTFSMILPNLVLIIVLMTPCNTRSEKNYRAMLYVYLFLIFMVLIFPTIGLNSGDLLLRKMFDSKEKNPSEFPKSLYKCLFQPASSAWFVQMIISSIFINNSMELLRLPELCLYLLNCIIYPRSEAEYIKARLETSFDFSYGSSYPRFLLIFTIVTTYSISCPIIAPFGLLYMVFKHLVDRYSIYYLYSTPVISSNIHQMAITFVLTSFWFLLFQLTAFLNTRIEFKVSFKPSNVCTVACLLYLILLCFACCNFSSLYPKDSSASRYQLSQGSLNRKKKSLTGNTTTSQTGH